MKHSTNIPTSVSVVTIVKNEEHNIEALFKTIEGMADELVIIDTGSTDGTVAKIKEMVSKASFSVRFEEKRFQPFHFGMAKNYAINKANSEYVFILDADERIGDAFRGEIKGMLDKYQGRVFGMNRQDELIPHYLDPQVRIFPSRSNIRYGEDSASKVDENLNFAGETVTLPWPLLHYQGKNHLLRKPGRNWFQLQLDVERTPRIRSTIRELARGVMAFYYIFKKVYFDREAYKDGLIGLAYAFMRAWYKFLVHFFVAFKPRSRSSLKVF